MKTKFLMLISILSFAVLSPQSTGAQDVPPPFIQATNQANALSPFTALLEILPSWDPALTNTFGAGEWNIESAPLWKSMLAAGTTPLNSTEIDYFFHRNIGIGPEIISMGDGTGDNTIDTINCNLTLRKDIGNIAGYLLLGAGYDLNREKGAFTAGPGVIYGYQTHIRLFLDTRCELEGTKQRDIGWLHRVGMQLTF